MHDEKALQSTDVALLKQGFENLERSISEIKSDHKESVANLISRQKEEKQELLERQKEENIKIMDKLIDLGKAQDGLVEYQKTANSRTTKLEWRNKAVSWGLGVLGTIVVFIGPVLVGTVATVIESNISDSIERHYKDDHVLEDVKDQF